MDYALHLTVLVLTWATLGLSQHLLTKYLGVLSVHQAACWGVGAYIAALLNLHFGCPLGLTLLPAALGAGAFAALVGLLIGRARREDQVTASLCIQFLTVGLLVNLEPLTRGAVGLPGIGWGGPSDQTARAIACGAALLLLYGLTLGLFRGLKAAGVLDSWRLIRDERLTAESFGLDPGALRTGALFLSAAIAGAAGSVYAHYLSYVSPDMFGLSDSVSILTVAVLGSRLGALGLTAAAVAMILIPELLRFEGLGGAFAANVRQIIFGAALVLVLPLGRRRTT